MHNKTSQFVKKFCLFKFFVSRTLIIKPLLDINLQKANSLEATVNCYFGVLKLGSVRVKNSASLNFCIENVRTKLSGTPTKKTSIILSRFFIK